MVGRYSEARTYLEKARELDPLYERNYIAEGYTDFMAHKYDQAIEQYRKGLEVEPDPMAYFGLVLSLAERGDAATAISVGEKSTKLNNSPLSLTILASAMSRILKPLAPLRIHHRPSHLSSYPCHPPAL